MSAPNLVALVGDVVASRHYPHQGRLLSFVQDALERTNHAAPAVQPLQPTVGDEFQGVYASVAQALRAALVVRLELAADASFEPMPDVRIGLGGGDVTAVPEAKSPFVQSGSGWWHARQALDHLDELRHQALWPRSLRTWYFGDGREDDLVNALLVCRDELLDGMDARDRRIALGLFRGEKQNEIAAALGISQPAVAKRQKRNGIQAVYRAQLALERTST
jgi:hypothetical protein